MAKRKSTAEELLDLISEICFYLPVWAILLIPIICGGGSYLAIDYLIQNKLQMMFAGEIGGTITVSVSLLVFALTAVAALKGFLGRKQRKALLAQTQSLDALRALSWQEFELLIAEVYRTEGFKVTELGGNGPDGGIDLTATASNGDHYLIQCKHFKTSKVGVKIVREMLGVLAKEGGHQAVVIATGAYTKDAIQFAEGQPIELIDGPRLIERIQAYKAQAPSANKTVREQPTQPTYVAPSSSAAPTQPADQAQTSSPTAPCPKCGSGLVERTAKRGPNAGNSFLGCSNFPKCRYTA
jgi:restriction system protein